MKRTKNALFIIDGQVDFCDPTGSLYVQGAKEDMERLGQFISKNASEIDYIGLTLDNHRVIDISHPSFWEDEKGNCPAPFTQITYAQIEAGVWTPKFSPEEASNYVWELDGQGEYPHFIWPEHCIIGSPGAAIVPSVMKAVQDWCRLTGKFHQIIVKGTYPLTEHFGAFRANIPVTDHFETQINIELIQKLLMYDNIYFAGEAKSHCVARTLKQAMHFPILAKKFVILEDCMSDVTGLGFLGDPIFAEAKSLGIPFTNSLITL